MKARTKPPSVFSIDSWVPFFFDKDRMPWIYIGNFDKRTIVHAEVVCGFRPEAQILISLIISHIDPLKHQVGFAFGISSRIQTGVWAQIMESPVSGLGEVRGNVYQCTVSDKYVADAIDRSFITHPSWRRTPNQYKRMTMGCQDLNDVIHAALRGSVPWWLRNRELDTQLILERDPDTYLGRVHSCE
jgi:hypothetical protein